MVRAFEILCLFFKIGPSVPVLMAISVGCRFKDRFFKVKAISVISDGLPLMYEESGSLVSPSTSNWTLQSLSISKSTYCF